MDVPRTHIDGSVPGFSWDPVVDLTDDPVVDLTVSVVVDEEEEEEEVPVFPLKEATFGPVMN